MNIGEVSKKYDISIDTLRYYEKIGLIDKVKKVGGKRCYNTEDISRIEFIKCMKNAGFMLDDIDKFMTLYKMGDKTLDDRINMLLNKKEKLLEEKEEKKKTLEFLNYKINLYKGKKEEK